MKELGECVGRTLENDDATIVEAAKSVLADVDLDYIVATRSAKGITVIAKDGRTWHNPATQQEVFRCEWCRRYRCIHDDDLSCKWFIDAFSPYISPMVQQVSYLRLVQYPIHRSELLDLWHSYKHSIQSKPLYTEGRDESNSLHNGKAKVKL